MKVKLSFPKCAWLCVALGLLCGSGCGPKSSSKDKPSPPAKVEMVPHESDLAIVTLTEEAEKRLGITIFAAEAKLVQQHRTFGGEVIVPSGRSIVISAPVMGVVKPSAGSTMPLPGTRVKAGEEIVKLEPLLTPERDVPTPAEQVQMTGAKATLVAAQVTAQGDVQRGQADVTAARIALDRASNLLADRAGSRRAVDDAEAIFNVATAVLKAAQERSAQLTKLLASLDESPSARDQALAISLAAPVDGVIRSLSVSVGQQVVGGAPLFEVLDTSQLWVRVPIFVDLLPAIDPEAMGSVVSLDGKSPDRSAPTMTSELLTATPIAAPPTADPGSSTADLYFEISNSNFSLRPGQRIGIDLPMNKLVNATIVPASSVVYDIHGGTWVYTLKEAHRYVRQRVAVHWFDGASAVLQNGIKAGTMVVADGAAELFGTEFGTGK